MEKKLTILISIYLFLSILIGAWTAFKYSQQVKAFKQVMTEKHGLV